MNPDRLYVVLREDWTFLLVQSDEQHCLADVAEAYGGPWSFSRLWAVVVVKDGVVQWDHVTHQGMGPMGPLALAAALQQEVNHYWAGKKRALPDGMPRPALEHHEGFQIDACADGYYRARVFGGREYRGKLSDVALACRAYVDHRCR